MQLRTTTKKLIKGELNYFVNNDGILKKNSNIFKGKQGNI